MPEGQIDHFADAYALQLTATFQHFRSKSLNEMTLHCTKDANLIMTMMHDCVDEEELLDELLARKQG